MHEFDDCVATCTSGDYADSSGTDSITQKELDDMRARLDRLKDDVLERTGDELFQPGREDLGSDVPYLHVPGIDEPERQLVRLRAVCVGDDVRLVRPVPQLEGHPVSHHDARSLVDAVHGLCGLGKRDAELGVHRDVQRGILQPEQRRRHGGARVDAQLTRGQHMHLDRRVDVAKAAEHDARAARGLPLAIGL
eukprot:2931765-Pleurochrysis_carterae.AAC.2